jgi:integrase
VRRLRPVAHYPALAWREMPELMAALRRDESPEAFALTFAILTAARTGEVLCATWAEVDFEARTWTVPAARVKTRRPHRVELSDPAIEVLKRMELIAMTGGYIFPGNRPGKPLSDQMMRKALRRAGGGEAKVHAMRAVYRTWIAEATSFPGELAEMAQGHLVGSEVERAYRRGDALERRRALMSAWADFLAGSTNVVALRR